MTRNMRWGAAFGLFVAACSTSLPETPKQIVGQWGGYHIAITDSLAAPGVLVNVGCVRALFPAPIPVDSLGNFEAFGAVIDDVYPPDIGRRTRISGHVVRNSMALDWTWTELDNPDQFEPPVHLNLTLGGAVDWSQLTCTA